MKLIPVEGNTGLYRDQVSGAILNCSDNDFDSYLQLKQRKIQEVEEFNSVKNKISEIDNIKSELNDMKDMIKLILSKLDSNS
jgi:hypothetical protein